jgi:hypothetical protein
MIKFRKPILQLKFAVYLIVFNKNHPFMQAAGNLLTGIYQIYNTSPFFERGWDSPGFCNLKF